MQAQATSEPNSSSPPNPNRPPADLNNCGSSYSFVDVPQDYQYYEAITYMACKGHISGYDGTHFGPNDAVMRGQYTRMVVNPFHWRFPNPPPDPPSYTDIANDTFRTNIEQASTLTYRY